MKANQIKQWTPMILVIAMTLFGVMSCTNNPTSSEPIESATYEMQANQSNEGYANTDDPGLVMLSGYLRASENSECWFLVVTPGETYELKMDVEVRGNAETQAASVIGRITDTYPSICSSYPVLLVKKLIIEWSPEHTD